jgi:tRNA threonylcarbamoyladenosine biosynthesis protein TsaE
VVIIARTKSADDTRALAAEVSKLARPGDLILLAGELGAGKTAFAQGFARGLGVADAVVSPAFILVRSYEGRLRLNHVDVYRLDHMQDLLDLGISELLDEGGVTLVEWGDVVAPGLSPDFLEVRLTPGDTDEDRRVGFAAVGATWAPRWDALRRAVEQWTLRA